MEPCFDTSTIHLSDFADWTKQNIPLENFLRFIGLQANAIHVEDPKVCSFDHFKYNSNGRCVPFVR